MTPAESAPGVMWRFEIAAVADAAEVVLAMVFNDVADYLAVMVLSNVLSTDSCTGPRSLK